jgi:hypothetical protein
MHPAVRQVVLGGFRISRLFANGTYAGFDFTDLDPAKTWGPDALQLLRTAYTAEAAVSASGTAVGYAIDKSQGLVLGSASTNSGLTQANTTDNGDGTWTIGPGTNSVARFTGYSLTAAALNKTTVPVTSVSTSDCETDLGDAANFSIPVGTTGDFSYYSSLNSYSGVNFVDVRPPNGASARVGAPTVRRAAGNHASQSTSSARPVYTESGALKYLAFDANDDGLFSTLKPTAAFTMAAAVRMPSSAAAAQVVLGAQASSSTRAYLAVNTSGALCGGWGTDGTSTIVDGDGTNLFGVDCVVLIWSDGATVELWLGTAAGGIRRVYTGPVNGSPTTTIAIALGALNNNGSLASYFGGRLYASAAVQRAIGEADKRGLIRSLGVNAGLSL